MTSYHDVIDDVTLVTSFPVGDPRDVCTFRIGSTVVSTSCTFFRDLCRSRRRMSSPAVRAGWVRSRRLGWAWVSLSSTAAPLRPAARASTRRRTPGRALRSSGGRSSTQSRCPSCGDSSRARSLPRAQASWWTGEWNEGGVQFWWLTCVLASRLVTNHSTTDYHNYSQRVYYWAVCDSLSDDYGLREGAAVELWWREGAAVELWWRNTALFRLLPDVTIRLSNRQKRTGRLLVSEPYRVSWIAEDNDSSVEGWWHADPRQFFRFASCY